VHIPNTFLEAIESRHCVAIPRTEDIVAGIENQSDHFRIGESEKLGDLERSLHVSSAMVMKNRPHSGGFANRFGDCVRARSKNFPLRRRERHFWSDSSRIPGAQGDAAIV